jgi:predicted double-glycine peptidase
MQQIIDVLRRQGVPSHYRRVRKDNIDHLPLPAIAFVRGNHFVLIEEVKDHVVTVSDPSIGRVQFARPIFNATWDGDVITSF